MGKNRGNRRSDGKPRKRKPRPPGQHFLMSAAARDLSVSQIACLSDDDAHALFKSLRWCDTGGEPVCPKCGLVGAYPHKSRRIYSCKDCRAQFSATSGTMFHSRKLSIRDILTAILLVTNSAKGHAALHLGRDMGVSYKTAFVLSHKLREALGTEIDGIKVGGVVEADAGHFGGHVRPKNVGKRRMDRRHKENMSGKRQAVIVVKQRDGRTFTYVAKNESDAVETMLKRIVPGTQIHADEAKGWDRIEDDFPNFKRINHSQSYSKDGACTNQAESFFSRLRRAEIGTFHHIAGCYLALYSHEMSWRDDARRISNGNQFLLMGLTAATHPPSKMWKGYWQRHIKKPEAAAG